MGQYFEVEITENQAVIYHEGKIVHRSKHFRHKWEAEEYAKEWKRKNLPNPITLDVQNFVMDSKSIFGGNKHG